MQVDFGDGVAVLKLHHLGVASEVVAIIPFGLLDTQMYLAVMTFPDDMAGKIRS